MADSNMADILKRFAQNITTASVRERCQILGDLEPCVEQKEFPDGAVKGILKTLLQTLGRYHDSKSRRAVENVVRSLAVHRFDAVSKHFPAILAEVAEEQKKAEVCQPTSAAAFVTLSWMCIIIRCGYKTKESMTGNVFNKLVELQALMTYGALASDRSSISRNAYNRLKRTWREIPGSIDCYFTAIQNMEQTVYQFCLISCIMRYLSANKDQERIGKYKAVFLDHYTKLVIGSRTTPGKHVLGSCKDLLRHINHEEFKGTMLPALERSMLRNPEIILQAFTELLAGLTIDLSPYALEVCKHLATHCHSKDEGSREIAALGCRHLAHQCSDTDAVEKLVKHFFAVLNGSEGKLTVVTQRMGMLSGIGNFSYNTVSGGQSVQNLACTVAEQFIPILQQEVHEGTLVHALSVFTLWCAKFSTQVPTKLIEWFKAGMAQKTSTSAVRNAYIQCMNTAFHGDTLFQGLDVLPLLTQTVEKASNQSSQVPIVSEALVASVLLARLSLSDIQAESKLGSFWNIILDSEKQLFINEKFLSSASDTMLQYVATLVERLTLDHPQKLQGKIARLYYRAIVYALTHGQYRLRKHVHSVLRRILSSLGGAKCATALLCEYSEILGAQKLVVENNLALENGELAESSRYISPRILSEALMTLACVPNAEVKEAEVIAMDTLMDAHHPCIVHHNPDQWTDILAALKVDASEFIKGHVTNIVTDLKNSKHISQGQKNAVSTLARVAPTAILPELTEHVCKSLQDPALKTVTREEYHILGWPEGELYDKSVIQSAQKEEKVTNVKRENKLYSYEEQMAELELKKELAKKKGKSLKEEPKLTKKQQEAVAAQLQKESEIRAKTKELDRTVENACRLVEACACGQPASLRQQFPALLRTIIPLMASPLAAPRLYRLYVDLGEVAFDGCDLNKNLALLVSHCTVRLLEPECTLDIGWSAEPLKTQATRAITKLHEQTVPPRGAKKNSPIHPLPAPTFMYSFYLLWNSLKSGGAKIGGDEMTILKALNIMATHAQLRESQDLEGLDDVAIEIQRIRNMNKAAEESQDVQEIDENGPALLPREEMLRLATQIIGTSSGRVQQMAAKVLLDTAEAGSANEGCTDADQGEIDALLEGLQSSATPVREAALIGLEKLEMVLPTPDVDLENGLRLVERIFVARYDVEEENKELAEKLWHQASLEVDEEICSLLVKDLVHHQQVIRDATAAALAEFLRKHRSLTEMVLSQILELYEDKLYMPPPVLDAFGRVMSEGPPDQWAARCGLALALQKLSPLLPQNEVETIFEFFVKKALGDRKEEVRKTMLDAAVAVVNDHGKANVVTLLPVFEEFLGKAPDSASYDSVRQSIVICMGSLAKHLDKDDPKVKPIVGKLIEALSTPSQQVQEAVANCLPPLVPAVRENAPDLVKRLLNLLLESEIYGERRGAAYGLAGLVKGLGILALKQLDIMTTLTEAIQNKKNPRYREGALFAFEMLCTMLGRLFEPYVVHLLPHLLLCFGDANQYVREAADDTAKAVMSRLSAHGVKMVLPSLLKALEEDSWRTKTGSVELLGAMAFCAPKQLSACLPSIVPKLTEVLTDSHLKVQKAGAQALKQIGSVIRNPEIQAIVPVLLEALQDPTKKTTHCLQRLLDTKFVHFIDSPSLALIMPVVQRSFQDRSTETRKMAAQIIGNMYSLTDQKDLSPYLPAVIPGLKQSLLDPVPEVRSVSSRALGTMVKGMGEGGFEELVPWLMQTLTSEISSVDRSGAAQGLSEVVGGLGMEKLQKLMPDIISTAQRTDIAPHVRDGYIMMFIYLPAVFGDDFLPYVGPIIPSVLKALADESEFVRDTALRAGQRLVSLYADTAIELLLPELERGLFDDNWRIRYSSVQLLGDLLYRISGVTGKMSTQSSSEDDNFGTETSQEAILSALGHERRNRVLAGLYMGRSDTALMVRQSALHVWKVIVTHTPKTLREILSTLFELLLGCLASTSYDKRQVAARTLGDIVRKLGEKVLPEIIPILEKGLESDQSDQRQGVCIGLSEIMSSTSKEHVIVFADSLIPTVRKALCDPLPEVREAAAKTFDNLHANIGSRALDEILPDLLRKLDDEDVSEYALDGLQQVMAIKSRVVLPYLVPQLTRPPVNTRALSFLSSVAGEALSKYLSRILPALMSALSDKTGTDEEQQELEYCQTVVLSVQDDTGIRTVMDELLTQTNNPKAGLRCAAVTILNSYCSQTHTDITEFVPQLFRGLIRLFTDSDEKVLHASWDCLNTITKKLDASEMLGHISNIRQAVRFAVSDFKEKELPGFCLPKKGISPILPIFREGILNGPPELKESAAIGLGEVIRRTSAEALKPSVLNITGPLIRILGDRFSFNVKVALLETLGLLLGKCGAMLKAFLPQLQTTFIKALNDTNRSVRLKAASALGKLIIIHTRVDPLFTELHAGIKNADDTAIRDTFLQALRGCICGAGTKMSDKIRKEITATLEGYLSATDGSSRQCAAACLGALCTCLPDDELSLVLNMHLLDADPSQDWVVRHGRGVALAVALKEAPAVLTTAEWNTRVLKALTIYSSADRIPICLSGLRGVGYLARYQFSNEEPVSNELITILVKGMKQDSNDIKQLAAQVVTFLGNGSDRPLDVAIMRALVPMLVNGTKEKNTVVRSNSEFALVSVLKLRDDDSVYKTCLASLEPGMRDSLTEVHNKVLKKLLLQPDHGDEDIDDTVLT